MKCDKNFESASFRGAFRDYQRKLLKKLEDRLDESKLNIVTPPGSGKVIIGLELIRRMGEPCLILSSTDVMRSHWAEHFVTQFLPDERQGEADQYISYSLKEPALLTSITYEHLYAAVKQGVINDRGQSVSFRDVDIIRLVQEFGIHTVLLDEPHHLSNHCMEALESFLGVLGGEIRIITLTGSIPMDLHEDELERYFDLCGETTEEIHIPDLVKSGALCPYQDYVYFNYPTVEETAGITGYRVRADEAVAEAMTLPFMAELNHRLTKLYRKKVDFILSHHESVVALLTLLHEYGHSVNSVVYKALTGLKNFESSSLEEAQSALSFLLESQTILRDGEKEQLSQVLMNHRVMEDGRAYLYATNKMRHTLTASVGKLTSISAITSTEGQNLGEKLRQIILTDPIRPNELNSIGQDKAPSHVNTVSVFETLRRDCPLLPVGCVVEDCAVLPCSVEQALVQKYGVRANELTVEPIGYTQYSFFRFANGDAMMEGVSRLFRDGYIRVLIGAANLIGHGWDDTFVNTLILAAFRSSSIEADRTRGRVLHADRNNHDKVAHIWHLVTIEQAYSTKQNINLRLASRLTAKADGGLASGYKALRRRFECYIGPNEGTGELENGIERLNLDDLTAEKSLAAVNNAMLARSANRAALKQMWTEATREETLPISEVRVPKAAKVPVFTALNTLLILTALVALPLGLFMCGLFLYIVYYYVSNAVVLPFVLVMVILLCVINLLVAVWGTVYLIYVAPLLLTHWFPGYSIRSLCRCIMKSMKDIGEIRSDALMVMELMADRKTYRIYLTDCTHDEQVAFQKAVAEMFSPIRNPRYIMVRGGWFHRLLWRWSFACPTVIGKNDISVKVFEKYVRRCMGVIKFQYTRRDPGRKYLILSRNKSYLNIGNVVSEKRLHLLKHDPML